MRGGLRSKNMDFFFFFANRPVLVKVLTCDLMGKERNRNAEDSDTQRATEVR